MSTVRINPNHDAIIKIHERLHDARRPLLGTDIPVQDRLDVLVDCLGGLCTILAAMTAPKEMP
jgi:hypothetical protein